MPHIAFATYREIPEIGLDDAPVADALRRVGVAVSPAVWDDATIDWQNFDAVVIRSTWDYLSQPTEYAAWVRQFASSGTKLWNPVAAILGNLHKSYLATLPGAVPTEYVPAGSERRLGTILTDRGWPEAVVKPAISAGAVGTWRTSRIALDEQRFAGQVRTADVLVQPYLAEVETVGEWSLVFFHGRFSHAVLKRPATGDFRVQEHLGGCSALAEASVELITQAEAALAAVGQPLLYARVDGVERGGRLLLTEMEITEPYLFLRLADGAAERFAAAILEVLPVG